MTGLLFVITGQQRKQPCRFAVAAAAVLALSFATGELQARQGQKTPVVEILLSSETNAYLESLNGFQSAYSGRVKLRYLDIMETGQTDFKSYFADIDRSGAPFYLAVGFRAAVLARRYLKNTPLLFSMVRVPKELDLDRNGICGYSSHIRLEEYFATLNEISERPKKVVSFYSSDQGRYLAAEGNYSDLRFNILYEAVRVKPGRLAARLEQFRGKISAVYMVPDALYNRENFKLLSDFCRENGIVLMSTFPALVDAGATFAFSADAFDMGRRTAALANDIVNKKVTCDRGPVLFGGHRQFFLNNDYARRSGVSIPDSIKKKAYNIQLYNLGVRLFNQEKYKSARAVFQKLAEDENAPAGAEAYLVAAVDRLTRGKTAELYRQLEVAHQAGEYEKAIGLCRAILKVNPSSPGAQRRLDRLKAEYSDRFYRQGSEQAAAGRIFAAVRLYNRALEIDDSHRRARAAVARTRQKNRALLDRQMKEGIEAYQKRNYSLTITLMDNALLLDPGNKSARRYQNLAARKKKAIEELKHYHSNAD